MKSLLKFAVIFLAIVPSYVFAQTGEVSGFVYNGTDDSSKVANIDVKLFVYHGLKVTDDSTYSTKTNSNGKYRITSLSKDRALSYYPSVNYKSVVYYGDGMRFSDEGSRLESNVVVYDTTTGIKNIFIQLEHLFLTEIEDKLEIKEIFIFKNSGNKTYVGDKTEQSNRQYVLQFPLANNFENLELITREAQHSIFVENQTIYKTDLFPPGTQQLSYRFQVPHSKKEWRYSRPMIYPTRSINIFIANPELTLEGPGIINNGDFKIRGENFQHYSVQNLMPGMQLSLTLKNLSRKSIPVHWIVLAAVALFLIIGFGYTLKKS